MSDLRATLIARCVAAPLFAKTLAVRFKMEPPGANAFRPIASGTLHRAAS